MVDIFVVSYNIKYAFHKVCNCCEMYVFLFKYIAFFFVIFLTVYTTNLMLYSILVKFYN